MTLSVLIANIYIFYSDNNPGDVFKCSTKKILHLCSDERLKLIH